MLALVSPRLCRPHVVLNDKGKSPDTNISTVCYVFDNRSQFRSWGREKYMFIPYIVTSEHMVLKINYWESVLLKSLIL